MAVLSVTHLRKNYGSTIAVDDLSFEVGRREIVGLLGPNGAGKTTTINMILGVLAPTSGTIRIEGRVLFVFGIAMGILGCAIVLRLGPSAEWFIWPIPAILSPFAGVFYPVSTLPRWMQAVSYLLPPSYVFEGMRAIVTGSHASRGSLVPGAALAVVYLLGACVVFSRVYHDAVRTGLIARYSAESVS